MAQVLTLNNIDTCIKRALDRPLSDIVSRLDDLERLVSKDIDLDRKQQDELPDDRKRLDSIYSTLEGIKRDIGLLHEELGQLRKQLDNFAQMIKEEI